MPLQGMRPRCFHLIRTDAGCSELKFYIVSLSINGKPDTLAAWPMKMK